MQQDITESSIPGPRSTASFGIPGLGYRHKPVLDLVVYRHPLRTAAANGKRIHKSIGQSGAYETSKLNRANETKRKPESLRVTVGLYKVEVIE